MVIPQFVQPKFTKEMDQTSRWHLSWWWDPLSNQRENPLSNLQQKPWALQQTPKLIINQPSCNHHIPCMYIYIIYIYIYTLLYIIYVYPYIIYIISINHHVTTILYIIYIHPLVTYTKNWKSPCCSWVNPLFQWAIFQFANSWHNQIGYVWRIPQS